MDGFWLLFVTSKDLSKTYQTETAAAVLPADETPNEQPPDTDKPPDDAQPCTSADTAVTIPEDHDEPVLKKARTPAPPTGQPPRPKPVPEPSDGPTRKAPLGDEWCDYLEGQHGCDPASIMALKLLSEVDPHKANDIVWQVMVRHQSINNISAYISGAVINHRKALGLDHWEKEKHESDITEKATPQAKSRAWSRYRRTSSNKGSERGDSKGSWSW